MVDTDVLIATRESDLYHMLLLLPNSVVIAFESNHLHYPRLNVLRKSLLCTIFPLSIRHPPCREVARSRLLCSVSRSYNRSLFTFNMVNSTITCVWRRPMSMFISTRGFSCCLLYNGVLSEKREYACSREES